MMKYERLTHRNYGCIEEYCEERHCIYCDKDGDCHFDKKSKHIDVSCDCFYAMAERLAELEDKIEQGTLIELPCKVGDIVYGLVFESDVYIEQYSVVAIEIGRETYLRCFEGKRGFVYLRPKSIFLTREEAEKRLKELQNDKRE